MIDRELLVDYENWKEAESSRGLDLTVDAFVKDREADDNRAKLHRIGALATDGINAVFEKEPDIQAISATLQTIQSVADIKPKGLTI